MKPLLLHLRHTHQYTAATLAQLLGITEWQYEKLELAESAATVDQLTALSRFYQIDLVTIHHQDFQQNHNIGTKSRGIFNITHYYENCTFGDRETDTS